MMHEIVYIRADFEPWWMFEGWEEKVVSRQEFRSSEDARIYLEDLMEKFAQQFAEHEQRGMAFTSYWNEEEMEYCEKCEEDLQIFHGLIWLFNGEPRTSF